MMRALVVMLLVLLAVGCAPAAPSPAAAPEAEEGDAAAVVAVDATTPPAVVVLAPPCALRVDAVAPSRVPRAGHVVVVVSGCGLSRVREVRVDVYPTAFAVVDDERLAVYVPVGDWFDGPQPQPWALVVRTDAARAESTITYEPEPL